MSFYGNANDKMQIFFFVNFLNNCLVYISLPFCFLVRFFFSWSNPYLNRFISCHLQGGKQPFQ